MTDHVSESSRHNFYKITINCLAVSCFSLTANLYGADPSWEPARTEYGVPNLQGSWNNISLTPLERPAELGNKRAYTEAEARAAEATVRTMDSARAQPLDPAREAPAAGAFIGQQADSNFIPELHSTVAVIDGEYRTSLIIDPPNGRMPRLTEISDIFAQWQAQGFESFDGPEIRPAGERCMNGPAQLPLIFPFGSSDTSTIQIVQNSDYVVILGEYSSFVRIIRLNSEHPQPGWNKWMGDSVGHWEHDALVVHTQNFRPEQSVPLMLPSTDALEIVETFIPVSADEIVYRYTISDPNVYSRPFTAEMPLQRLAEGERLFEEACHEGNYALPGILAGARRQELDAQQ